MPLFFCFEFLLFPHGFAAMAAMTKTFQILRVREYIPIALVIPDMIYVCCFTPLPSSGALPAERFFQELAATQLLPCAGTVHPTPRLGRVTPSVFF